MSEIPEIHVPEIVQPGSDAPTLEARGSVLELVETAIAFEITDDASDAAGANLLAQVSTLRKAVEERRKEVTGPVNRLVKETNDAYRSISAPLDQAEKHLKAAWSKYRKAKAEEEARARTKAAAEAEAARQAEEEAADDGDVMAELEAAGKRAALERSAREVPVAEAPARSVKTVGGGTVHTRRKAKFEVVDAKRVPRNFLIVNEKAIGAAVRAGVTEIDGVRIWTEDEVSVRTAGGKS